MGVYLFVVFLRGDHIDPVGIGRGGTHYNGNEKFWCPFKVTTKIGG